MVVPTITTNVKSDIILTGAQQFGVGALAGEATWGDLNTVYIFSNYQEVVDTFKTGSLVKGARYFFNNGGRELKAVRVTPTGTSAMASSIILMSDTTECITLTGKKTGTHGNNISVTVLDDAGSRSLKISDGEIEEEYLALATNTEIVEAINEGSELVSAVLDSATPLIDVLSQTFLTGGLDGVTSTQDYIDVLSEGGNLWLKEYDYLMIPGKTDNAFHASIQTIMDARASAENLFSIYVTGVDKFEDIETTLARNAMNQNGRLVVVGTSIYKGSGLLTDTANWDDASYTACAYAGILCSSPVNESPTNKIVGFTGAKTLSEQFYTTSEKRRYADAGFTIFDRLYNNQYGTVIAVTRNGDETRWEYMLDSRRKVDFLLSNTVNIQKQFLGQPNDEFTRRSIKSGVSSIMVGARTDRIINTYLLDVLQGTDPRAVDVNITVSLVNEVTFINVNLTLTI